ncbi:DUF2249 domain-containing protein [Sulfobacillus harzensis]|nr:DUF2249 domain-containing protein [Sulfobacillus harzensis]
MDYPSALVLNAWTLPSNIRHEVIFRVLDALPPYQAVTLINDHDPKPLFYQLDAEQPGAFSRETVSPPQPELFAVVITRRPKRGEITLLS